MVTSRSRSGRYCSKAWPIPDGAIVMSQHMHCITSSVGRVLIRRGTYSLVVSVDGTAPWRQATIVDGWGGLQRIKEREDEHWQLVEAEIEAPVEFVPA